MRIVNAVETVVPEGDFAGMDLQEFAQEHPEDAEQMLDNRTFRLEYPSQYQDLQYYLQAGDLYSGFGLNARRKRRRRWH